jgi:hypothetical protein
MPEAGLVRGVNTAHRSGGGGGGGNEGCGFMQDSGRGPGRRMNGAARPPGLHRSSSRGGEQETWGRGKKVQEGKGRGHGETATVVPNPPREKGCCCCCCYRALRAPSRADAPLSTRSRQRPRCPGCPSAWWA